MTTTMGVMRMTIVTIAFGVIIADRGAVVSLRARNSEFDPPRTGQTCGFERPKQSLGNIN